MPLNTNAILLWISRIQTCGRLDFLGSIRFSCRLLNFKLDPTLDSLLIEDYSVFIAVARVGRLRLNRDFAPRQPFVAILLLDNGLGPVIAVIDSGPQNGAVLPPASWTRAASVLRHLICAASSSSTCVTTMCSWVTISFGPWRFSVCSFSPVKSLNSAPTKLKNNWAYELPVSSLAV